MRMRLALAAAFLLLMGRIPEGRDAEPRDGAVAFTRTETSPESYRIDADARHAAVAAGDASGLLYGAITLWQLAPTMGQGAFALAAVHIEDAPRFPWRGLMLDSARHLQ